jgi:hypothetical protein
MPDMKHILSAENNFLLMLILVFLTVLNTTTLPTKKETKLGKIVT